MVYYFFPHSLWCLLCTEDVNFNGMKYINFSVFIEKQNLSIDKKNNVVNWFKMYHFFQGPNVVMVLFEKSFLIHWGFCSFLTILWCAWSLLLSLMEIKMSFPFPCIHIANCPRATYRQLPSALGGSAYTARQQGPSVAGLISVMFFSSFVLLQYRGGLATIYLLKISVHLQ